MRRNLAVGVFLLPLLLVPAASVGRCAESMRDAWEQPTDRQPAGPSTDQDSWPPAAPRQTHQSQPPRSVTPQSFARGLASTPPMFGDIFVGGLIEASTTVDFVIADLPLAGGCRRVKVAEHNSALPVNRVFLNYNHVHSALNEQRTLVLGGPVERFESSAVDRYTFGFESTFQYHCWSVEMRMPFSGGLTNVDGSFQLSGGEIGNLALIFKRLLYASDHWAVSGGIGIDMPTGSDARGRLPLHSIDFSVQNQSVHLLPYLGLLSQPRGGFFWHGFAQLDIPANGNHVIVRDRTDGSARHGILTEPTLLYLDLAAGLWLHRDPCAPWLTGAAGVLELHYTAALQDADRVPLFGGLVNFGSPNRFDIVNATAGLHMEIARQTQLRIGGVFPLGGENHRFFDSEVTAALIRQY